MPSRHQYADEAEFITALRDYFAAKAMHALLCTDGTTHFPQRVKEAYDVADEMLKARSA